MDAVSDFPIAIVGMGCRFPGEAESISKFWEMLCEGRDGISEVPPERWDVRRFYDPDPNKPGKTYTKFGGYLRRSIEDMDALFFGISPREAENLDPQQRVLLEVTWEALEDAGIPPDTLAGSATGVFVGGFIIDHTITVTTPFNRPMVNSHSAVSFTHTILSARIAYHLDLRGPCLTIDTACSSSLVALHQACLAIRSGEATMALVGGVNIMYRSETSLAMCKSRFLAKDGRSKSFDARADGYGRGEGAGMVVLKPLSVARRDGDRIYAVIRGTGVNQDGRTDGITVPNDDAQAELIRAVCAKSGVRASQISYFEAHGTGTPIGDPKECSALGRVLGSDPQAREACWVGSVKANIGHLEAAAGVAGVIKTALVLHHRKIPPVANLGEPNPAIDFSALGLRLPRGLEDLPTKGDDLPLAGVNSFGYGGTNAHALLQAVEPKVEPRVESPNPRYFLPISARSENALSNLAWRYRDLLAKDPETDLHDLCWSAATRRTHHPVRLALVGDGRQALMEQLEHFAEGRGAHLPNAKHPPGQDARNPVFVFTGMGPQWWAMGRELLASEPVFREMAEQCDAAFEKIAGWSILEEMTRDEEGSRIMETQIAQPANFVLQASLYALWRSKGITPAAIVGHSVGDVTASYAAGVLTLEDALTVSYHRSRLQKTVAGQGKMLAVGLDEGAAQALVDEYGGDKISFAAINSPGSITLTGDAEVLDRIAERLEEKGVFNRFLRVELAYHSPVMDVLKEEVLDVLAGLRPSLPEIPLYSTVTGDKVENAAYDADYWYANIRQPVLFAKAIQAMIHDGHTLFLEIGPHPVLSSSIKETASAMKNKVDVVASLNRKEPEIDTFYRGLAELYVQGAVIDWQAFYPEGGRFLQLPLYPWQRDSYWLDETEEAVFDRKGSYIDHPLLGHRKDSPEVVWEHLVNAQFLPWLPEHNIQGLTVMPGAAYVEIGLTLFNLITEGQAIGGLEDLCFQRALVVNELDEPLLHTRYDRKRRIFSVYSRPRDSRYWTLHAQGRLSMIPPAAPDVLDLSALRARCNERLDVAEFYGRLTDRGMEYGPSFQSIQELRRGDDELLVHVALNCDEDKLFSGTEAGEEAKGHYRFHPTLLDGVFQSFISLLDEEEDNSFVPVSMGEIHFWRYPGAELWAYGRITLRDSQRVESNVYLCDAQGNVMVEVLHLRYQALDAVGGREVHRREPEKWLYQVTWEELGTPKPARHYDRCLLFVDREGRTEKVADALELSGIKVTRVLPGDVFSCNQDGNFRLPQGCPEEMAALFGQIDLNHYRLVVYGWGLDCDPETDPDGRGAAYEWIACLRQVGSASNIENPITLFLLTENSQPVGDPPFRVAPATLIGLGRVAPAEYPMNCCLIDLPAGNWEEVQEMLVAELLGGDLEVEIALRPGKRYAYRLDTCTLEQLSGGGATQSFELPGSAAFTLEGGAKEYHWREGQRREVGSGEVEVHVEYTVIPPGGLRPDGDTLVSVAGRVINVDGEGEFAGNARIIGLLPLSHLSSYITLPAGRLYAVPLTEQAGSDASLMGHPVDQVRDLKRRGEYGDGAPDVVRRAASLIPFATALFALRVVAGLQAGERVLIHSSIGDIDLTAAQVALAAGAEVFVVCNDEARRDRLKQLGVQHLFSGDSLGFVREVMRLTQGQGVQVVLNASDGEWVHKALGLVAAFGHFIDLGGAFNDWSLLVGRYRNLNIHKVDIRELLRQRPGQFRQLLKEVNAEFDAGRLIPLEVPLFAAGQVADALLHAKDQSVALEIGAADRVNVLPAEHSGSLVRADGSYLITGGFGGFGLIVARWLAAQGAKTLVLVGRRGAADNEAKRAVKELERQGVAVIAIAADVGREEDVKRLIEEIRCKHAPLIGIVHTAGVLDDAMLTELTPERLDTVMQPKAMGAWYLHKHTLDLPLDFFVMFSSISALVGKPGQGNYVAANAFLDQLAWYRNAQGLPGLSLNWGVLANVGMAARQQVGDRLTRIGINSFTGEEAMQMMEWAMRGDKPQLGLMNVDWRTWWETNRTPSAARRYGLLLGDLALDQERPAELFLRRIKEVEPEERGPMVIARMVSLTAAVMRLPEDGLDPDVPLNTLGLDSLMGVELRGAIEIEFGVSLSVLDVLQGGSITELSEKIIDRLGV